MNRLEELGAVTQFQEELPPPKPVHRRFDIRIGRCFGCGRPVRGRHPVQGRHPLQTSGATDAAGSQLGPRTHAAIALLNKELGLSHGKTAVLLKRLCGLTISRAAAARSVLRTTKRCRRAAADAAAAVRASPAVVPDETGWRVAGRSAWLHVFAGPDATVYEIDPTRSAGPALRLPGAGWSGRLTHDGWRPYDRLTAATHQHCTAHQQCTAHQHCTAHQLRRTAALAETACCAAARFPLAVRELLQRGLRLREAGRTRLLCAASVRLLAGGREEELAALVKRPRRHAGGERLAKFLRRHAGEVFAYLRVPGADFTDADADATNWRAEEAVRPAVVNRKVWGGNRDWSGAAAQSTLMTVIRTCTQRTVEPLAFLADALTAATPLPLCLR